MHDWYVVSYVYVTASGRYNFNTQKVGLSKKAVDARPLPMQLHALLIEYLGTVEVSLLNYWKVDDADGTDV